MRSYWGAAFVVPFLAIGCTPPDQNEDGIRDGVRDPTAVILTAPSTPTGTVSGQILTTKFAPLEGATVTLIAGGVAGVDGGGAGATATTDANGNFTFTKVPSGGSLLLTITKSGYASVHVTTSIDDSSGNVPVSNANANIGPYTLTATGATLKFLAVTNAGRPAKGAKATIEAGPSTTVLDNNSSTYGTGLGVVVAEATADDNGILTFNGIPAPEELTRIGDKANNYIVTIQAIDNNGDGLPDSAGSVTSYRASSLLTDTSTRVITLPDPRNGSLQVVASNVGTLRASVNGVVSENTIRPTDPIYLVYGQNLIESSITVRLTDETGKVAVNFTKALTGGNVLTITPASLNNAKEYNLSVHVVSADSGASLDSLGYFFAADATPLAIDVVSVSFVDSGATVGTLETNERVFVTFNQPVGNYGGNLNQYIVYFGKDLDLDGNIGNASGEANSIQSGYLLSRTEHDGISTYSTSSLPGLMALSLSGYSTRYSFVWSGPTIAASTGVQISFNYMARQSTTAGLQTIWGQPLSGNLTPTMKPLTAVSVEP